MDWHLHPSLVASICDPSANVVHVIVINFPQTSGRWLFCGSGERDDFVNLLSFEGFMAYRKTEAGKGTIFLCEAANEKGASLAPVRDDLKELIPPQIKHKVTRCPARLGRAHAETMPKMPAARGSWRLAAGIFSS